MNGPQFDYVQGQLRESFPALLASFEAESRAATVTEPCVLDVRYGPLARQTFDFFAAHGKARGTLAYFHAGYWQSRDKSGFRFIAPAFNAAGLNVALVNYPLCPTVTLPELVEATHASIPAIQQLAADGDASHTLVLAGHSAGAHLAVELALSQAASPSPMLPIAGIVALSGIFDLAPLIQTTLNDRLRLDQAGAEASSPLHRVRGAAVPALIAFGDEETRAFGRQSARLHQAWQDAGNRSVLHAETRADHFSLLRAFATPGQALFGQVLGLFD